MSRYSPVMIIQRAMQKLKRMMRTIKEEITWLNEFGSFDEAKEKIGVWIEGWYNKVYIHSKLGYKSPEAFEAEYFAKERINKAA